jgi:hypothetical protein
MSETTKTELLVKRLRMFLRDDAALNKLITGKESSDSQLLFALEDSVDDFINTPPLIGRWTLDNHPSRRILIHGAAIEVLRSTGLLQSRNRLSYNDGGVSVQVSDKAGEYQTWLSEFSSNYERSKRELKMALNIEQCYGGVSSEYSDLEDYT